jgi:epoxyqueuosine reductase
MTMGEYQSRFRGRAIKRAKREGLARNAAVALGNSGDRAAVPALADALTRHDAPLVRGHAAWALGHLGGKAARTALERCRMTEPDDAVRGEMLAALGT